MAIHFSWAPLVSLTVSIAQCWSGLAVTAGWRHHLPLKAIRHGSSLPSAAAKPCHRHRAFGREAAGHSPISPPLGSLVTPQPDPAAPSSWRAAGTTNLHLEHGVHLGWKTRRQSPWWGEEAVLRQWKAAAECQCHSPDPSLCDTAQPGSGRAQGTAAAAPGWSVNRARQSPTPQGSPSAAKHQRCSPRWHLYQVHKHRSFCSCAPHAIARHERSPSPTPPLQAKPCTQLIAQDICDDGLPIYRHFTGPWCNWEPLFYQSV